MNKHRFDKIHFIYHMDKLKEAWARTQEKELVPREIARAIENLVQAEWNYKKYGGGPGFMPPWDSLYYEPDAMKDPKGKEDGGHDPLEATAYDCVLARYDLIRERPEGERDLEEEAELERCLEWLCYKAKAEGGAS